MLVLPALIVIVGVAIATATTVLRSSENGWQDRADRAYFTSDYRVAAFEGQIWVTGRWSGADSDVVEIYDPGSNRWFTGPPLPEGLNDAALISTGGDLYLLGGRTEDLSASLADVYRLDRESGQTPAWRPAAPLPAPRVFGAAAWDGTRIIYAGGVDLSDERMRCW